MKKSALVALACSLASQPAWSQDFCQSYMGTTLAPITIKEAAVRLSKLTPKDEFETTAAYDARIAAALGETGGTLLLAKKLEDAKYIEYDADAGVLRIRSFALQNTGFDPSSLWGYGGPLDGKVDRLTFHRGIEVSFDESEKVVGSYTGTNSFGASAKIAKIDRDSWGV